jgi:thiamine biosynthesis lipoprotein
MRPLVLDLGAVAKGLAIDLAARELAPLRDFAIDAGGDLYLGGRGPGGRPWRAGIRHPREDGILRRLAVTDAAVCTSGDYERRAPEPQHGHHLIDARTGASVETVSSATVIAPTAMVGDAFATAAFVLGPSAGLSFLAGQGVEGLIVSASLEQHATPGFETTFGDAAVLRDAEGAADHPAGGPRRARRSERRRPADRARSA